MNRLCLLGAVGGSFLIGFGLGSYFAKPSPVVNYHTPVTPAKEEDDMPDEKTAQEIMHKAATNIQYILPEYK